MLKINFLNSSSDFEAISDRKMIPDRGNNGKLYKMGN